MIGFLELCGSGSGGGAQKKKDLTAAEGHVLLLEYLEEHPLLLSRPAMGARLSSYYRKRFPLDAWHQRLAAGAERWRLGQVDALQPDDEPPFALGNLQARVRN